MISVIIPTYNRSRVITEAIQSVLAQTAFHSGPNSYPYEIIVVDDGSTDETQAVVSSLEGPIRYYYQEHQGVSRARNRGLELARGEFIAFLDSDDLWLPEKIKKQMNVMHVFPQLRGCTTEEIWLRKGRRVNPRPKHKKPSGWFFPHALSLCLLSLSASLFRRAVFEEIGMFDESLPVCEDYDFSLRYALRYPLHLVEKPLIIKRGGHPDQLSRQFWGMDRFRVKALLKLFRLNLSSEQAFLVRKEIIRKAQIILKGAEKRGHEEEIQYYRNLIDQMQLELAASSFLS